MMIDVAVAYKGYGKVEGARVSSSVGFAEMFSYDIPLLDEQEAPVIAAWHDDAPANLAHPLLLGLNGARRDEMKLNFAIYHGAEIVRSHGGGYWRPLRMYELIEGNDEDCTVVDLAVFSRALGRSKAKALAKWQNENTRKTRTPEEHFGQVEKTNREIARREAGNYLSRFILVNGTVYTRCGPPIVIFEERRFGRPARDGERNGTVDTTAGRQRVWHAKIIRLITTDRDERFTLRDLVFPVQAFEDVFKRVKRLNAQMLPEEKAMATGFNAARAPTFLDGGLAETLDADECSLNLLRFISIVEGSSPNLLPAGDHRRLKLFCDLTEALALLPGDEGFDLLEAAAREYLDRYSYYEEYHHREQIALKRALEIAESRDVTIDAAFPTPTGHTLG